MILLGLPATETKPKALSLVQHLDFNASVCVIALGWKFLSQHMTASFT